MVFTSRFFAAALTLTALLLVIPGLSWPATAALDSALLLAAALDIVLNNPGKAIRARREISPRLTMGRTSTVVVRLANMARRPLDVRLRELLPPGFGATVATMEARVLPGGEASLTYAIKPERRGSYFVGPLAVRVPGPLGLTARPLIVAAAEEVRIFPDIADIRAYELALSRGLVAELGLRPSRWRGIGTEFESVREYLPDDEWRRVNWKATARVGKPITNQYSVDRSQHVMVALDVSRLMTETGGSTFKIDAMVRAALMICYVALAKGDHVGITVFSDTVHAHLPPRRGRGQLNRIVEALQSALPRLTEANYREAFVRIGAHTRRSLVIVLTDVMDVISEYLPPVLAALNRRHLVLFLLVGDERTARMAMATPSTSMAVFRQAMAEQVLDDRGRVRARLRETGTLVEDVLPRQLTVTAVNKYLEIKSRGRL